MTNGSRAAGDSAHGYRRSHTEIRHAIQNRREATFGVPLANLRSQAVKLHR
jgi:hypothetical protein